MDEQDLCGAIARLAEEFPDVPRDAIASMFGDSYQLVVEVSDQPLVETAEQLTELRLEVRTGHPAR